MLGILAENFNFFLELSGSKLPIWLNTLPGERNVYVRAQIPGISTRPSEIPTQYLLGKGGRPAMAKPAFLLGPHSGPASVWSCCRGGLCRLTAKNQPQSPKSAGTSKTVDLKVVPARIWCRRNRRKCSGLNWSDCRKWPCSFPQRYPSEIGKGV
jgi:hypothetical protein